MSMSFFYCGAQNWTQYSRWSLSKVPNIGETSLADLLTAQCWVGHLCNKGAQPAHIQLVDENCQVLSCKSAFQLIRIQPLLSLGFIPFQMQDIAFAFVELREDSSFLWLAEVLLNSSPDLQHIDCSP